MNAEFIAEYFSKPFKESAPDEYGYGLFLTEKFRVDTFTKGEKVLVAVDLRSCFNKVSQSPIHFVFPLKKRQEKRLKKAVESLLEFKNPGTLWGILPGFDEFSSCAAWNEFKGR